MILLSLIGKAINQIPFERIFFPPRDPVEHMKKFVEEELGTSEAVIKPPIAALPVSVERVPSASASQGVAAACVPCALGHFSRSAGALEEAMRFKGEGIACTAILDRVGDVLKEQNALERFDLTPEKIRSLPQWEKELAEEALEASRRLRHLLEELQSFDQLEEAAASTATFYKRLNREWFKRRLAQPTSSGVALSAKVTEKVLSLEEAKRLASAKAEKEVERQWDSLKTK